MTIAVTHSTAADSSFSATGVAAWEANHVLTGVGTMAEQDANNVNITGGSISGVTVAGVVTSVSGTLPISSSGGTTPAISISQAGASTNGYLSSTDWNTFNSKQPAGSYLTAVTADSPLSGAGTSASHLVIAQAGASTSGYLSSTDWNTFNNKQPAGTYVTSVGATSPVTSSGGTTPTIAIPQATSSVSGYLTNTDWSTFNNKANSGANSDITSMSGITGGISTPEYVQFDTTNTVTRATGRLWWDSSDGIQTLNLGMAGSNATMQIGEELYYRIKASSAITEGQVVMFSGTVGGSGALTGAPATGLTASTTSYVMGIATEDIALNGWGYVTSFGLVRGINTTGGAEAWVDGQILYYNPSVAGGLTKTVPTAPNAKIQVCAVVNAASGGSGSLFVRPTYGGALGQFEGDVQVTSPSSGNILTYDGSYWYNATSIGGGVF